MSKVLRWATLVFLSSALASAAVVTFSGFDVGAGSGSPRPNSNTAAASFDAAAGLLGTESIITFESSTLGSFADLLAATGVHLTGSDAFSANQTIVNSPVGTPDSLFGYNTTASGSRWASFYGGTMTFTFTTPTRAFGAYFSGLQLDGEAITFNDGSPQSVSIPNPGSGGIAFVGFTDSVGISSITINVIGDIVGMDDVRYLGSTSAVPEPASFLLFGTALLGMGFWRLRHKSV